MKKNSTILLDEEIIAKQQDQETKLSILREALLEGEESGKTKYSLESFIKELDSE